VVALRVFLTRLLSLVRTRYGNADLDEELRHHATLLTEQLAAGGLSEEAARLEARRQFGSLVRTKEAYRERRGLPLLEQLTTDMRQACRGLMRAPAFTCLTVLTLGLAVGACTVMYSVVYGVALRPLPYPHADQIVRLSQIGESGQLDPFSDPNFDDLRAQTTAFDTLAEYSPGPTTVVAGDVALRLGVSTVSRDFFDTFTISPSRGRRFEPEELHEGAPRAAIVSDQFWRQYFGNVTDLSAARLQVNGEPHAVVGVMPAGFAFPTGVDIWTPREARPRSPFRNGESWQVVGRLRTTVTLVTARADATRVARRLKQRYGSGTFMSDVATIPLQEDLVGSVRPVLYLLLTSVVFLLVVACANLANILLVRTSARRRELAVRSALGATGAALLLPLVAEALMVAALGGAVGIALAYAGVRAITLLDIATLPHATEIGVSWAVLVFAIGVTSLTALTLATVAGWQARRPDTAGWLKDAQRGQTASPSVALLRNGLVVAQFGVSVVLLIGAGLLGRSLAALLSQDPGFRRDGLLTIDVSRPGPKERATPERLELDDPSSLPKQAQLNERLLERLHALPGVMEAGGVSRLPMGGPGSAGTFIIARDAATPHSLQDLLVFLNQPDRTGHADFRVASAGYFRAMGIPLLRGRLFEEHDAADTPHVALISESLARTRWHGQDPIGVPVQFGGMDGDLRVFTIVGIVGDVIARGLDSRPEPTFYGEYRQRPLSTFSFTVVLRTAVDPTLVVADARRVVHDISPDVPPRFRTLNEVVAASVASRRLTLILTTCFAGAAMLVAILGIYGVLSYVVAQRRREFGVRIALGAQWSDVQRLVLGEAGRLLILGLALGVSAALAMSRLLDGVLFGVKSTDPTTYAMVATMLALAALVACEVPALRAARIDPAQALRAE
jgi:putative ABC transport system permease protein